LWCRPSIADTFIEKLTSRVREVKVGHPSICHRNRALIHERHLDKVCRYFEVARQAGAQRGRREPHDGPART